MAIPMIDGAHHERWQLKAANFLVDVWSQHPRGYCFVGARRAGTDKWKHSHFSAGATVEDILSFLTKYHRDQYDLYFCVNAFRRPRRQARYALPTPFAWVDIDEGDVQAFDPSPNAVWETSPGRTQGLWAFFDVLSAEAAERYSRALAYNFASDRTGWSATKYLRVPFSTNHKREYDRPEVRLLFSDFGQQVRKKLVMGVARRRLAPLFAIKMPDPLKATRLEVLQRYRRRLSPHCRAVIQHDHCFEPDRSARIFEMVVGLHEAGATPDEIGSVLWSSPYFLSKYGPDRIALSDELWRIIEKVEGGL